ASISTSSIYSTASRTTSSTTIVRGCLETIQQPQNAVTAESEWTTSTSIRSSHARSAWRWLPGIELLRERHQGHAIDQAVGQHEIAVRRDRSIAHDVAAPRNRPALEFLGLRFEAHHCIRLGFGFAVPEDVVDRRDAIGRGFRPARRLPFGNLAGRRVQAAQVAARIVGVPDD